MNNVQKRLMMRSLNSSKKQRHSTYHGKGIVTDTNLNSAVYELYRYNEVRKDLANVSAEDLKLTLSGYITEPVLVTKVTNDNGNIIVAYKIMADTLDSEMAEMVIYDALNYAENVNVSASRVSDSLNCNTDTESFNVYVPSIDTTLSITKEGSRWVERDVNTGEQTGGYMSYLSVNDILDWLRHDYGEVELVEPEVFTGEIIEGEDEPFSDNFFQGYSDWYTFIGDSVAANIGLRHFNNGTTDFGGYVYILNEETGSWDQVDFQSSAVTKDAMIAELKDDLNNNTLHEVSEKEFNKFISDNHVHY